MTLWNSKQGDCQKIVKELSKFVQQKSKSNFKIYLDLSTSKKSNKIPKSNFQKQVFASKFFRKNIRETILAWIWSFSDFLSDHVILLFIFTVFCRGSFPTSLTNFLERYKHFQRQGQPCGFCSYLPHWRWSINTRCLGQHFPALEVYPKTIVDTIGCFCSKMMSWGSLETNLPVDLVQLRHVEATASTSHSGISCAFSWSMPPWQCLRICTPIFVWELIQRPKPQGTDSHGGVWLGVGRRCNNFSPDSHLRSFGLPCRSRQQQNCEHFRWSSETGRWKGWVKKISSRFFFLGNLIWSNNANL